MSSVLGIGNKGIKIQRAIIPLTVISFYLVKYNRDYDQKSSIE